MDHPKKSITNITILFLFLATVFLLSSWNPLIDKTLISFQEKHPPPVSYSTVEKDELETVLQKASMENKTVIIAIANKAYVEPHENEYPTMFDLFIEGFWAGEETRSLVDHVLVVAMDQAAYDRCIFRRLHCYLLVTGGVDFAGEKLYMSEDFIKMMWSRTRFLLEVLKRGYNFIFTDMDVLWLRNPFLKLSNNATIDLQMSTDKFNGNPSSDKNPINTGFYFIRSNNKTISLFETWYDMRKNSTGFKEQDVLLNLVDKGVFGELEIKARFLDTLYFSGFCSDSKDVTLVTTVHANCCRSIGAKVTDLKAVLADWRRVEIGTGNLIDDLGSSSNYTKDFQWSQHVACRNSWHQKT